MMRWLPALMLLLVLAGCSPPRREVLAGPALEPDAATAAAPAGLGEPAPPARPRERPPSTPRDDRIGGTGCPVD